MNAPPHVETPRLVMTVPRPDEAAEIFERYANDPDVTRYLGWPTHQTLVDTDGFLAFSAGQWKREGLGPYLIRSRETGQLLGSTGLGLTNPNNAEQGYRALTGYVLARDAWGRGYATEALRSMVDVAANCGIVSLSAICHPEHRASAHVLEKCGFARDLRWTKKVAFPNLADPSPQPVWCFTRSIRN